MNRKKKVLLPALAIYILSGWLVEVSNVQAQNPGERPKPVLPVIPVKGDTTHTLAKHFTLASNEKKTPDDKGFIQRWLVLEPIRKDIARNNVLTETYLRESFSQNNFSNDFTAIPKNNKTVNVGDKQLKWYALDSKAFNFNLYHFTYAIDKPRYGNIYWLVTVINCPAEIRNVRMAAGVNSGGMFWLNGNEVLVTSGDKDMIVDNVTSPLLTLKAGRNVIRAAVINGPGMCNFSLRFVDEKGLPVKNFRISYE
jgi:hypothetical protein